MQNSSYLGTSSSPLPTPEKAMGGTRLSIASMYIRVYQSLACISGSINRWHVYQGLSIASMYIKVYQSLACILLTVGDPLHRIHQHAVRAAGFVRREVAPDNNEIINLHQFSALRIFIFYWRIIIFSAQSLHFLLQNLHLYIKQRTLPCNGQRRTDLVRDDTTARSPHLDLRS